MKFLVLTNTTVIVTLLNLQWSSNIATAFVPCSFVCNTRTRCPILTSGANNDVFNREAIRCNDSHNHESRHDDDNLTSRGVFLSKVLSKAAIASLSLSNIPLTSNALETSTGILLSQQDVSLSEFSVFQDDTVGFQIKTPAEWKKTEQTLPDRRKIVLFVNEKTNNDNGEASGDGDDKDLMFIAYTPVRDDFTSLSSFGSVDQVAQMTILPKGQIAGQDSESKMIVAEAKKNSYYFDYISKPVGQPKRHFRTIFTLIQGATGGAGAVLVTITAQTTEDRYNRLLKSMFDEIMDSYATTTRKSS